MSQEQKVEKKIIGDGIDPLCQVKGVGPKTAEKMRECGIDSLSKLAMTRPEELKAELNITLKASKDIIQNAKEIALDGALKPMSLMEVVKHKKEITKKIQTGSLALDNLLRGGISTESIVILSGEYSSGKTQLCYQLAVNVIKSGRQVAWIETESGTFVPDRIIEIAKANAVKLDDQSMPFVMLAKNIGTPANLFLTYELLHNLAKKNKWDIGLIIIDSFSAKFRGFYIGRETLPDRSKEEARHFGFLDQLASEFNCAIVLTNQIMDTPDQGGQFHNLLKTGTKKEFYGGNVLKHSGTYLLSLQKVKTDVWECIVADAPDIPFSSVYFRITEQGIRDVAMKDMPKG